MKQRISLLVILLTCGLLSRAQQSTRFQVLADQPTFTLVDVNPAQPNFQKVQTPQGEQVVVRIDQGSALMEKGAPDLPQLSFSLLIPNRKQATVSLVEGDYIDYPNVFVAPGKGKIYRNQVPSQIPFTYGASYQEDTFFPAATAVLNTPYVLRDFRGQTVQVRPVQYNPVTKVLRVYHHLRLRIDYSGESFTNVLPEGSRPQTVTDVFHDVYANHFLNYKTAGTRYTPLTQTGTMLVLCPANYLDEIAPYVKWKRMKGIPTILVNTDTMTGGVSESTVRNLVSYYYTTRQIAYLVIVGDHQHIPTRNADQLQYPQLLGPSDNGYAYQTGSDHYPEFIVGRFSGETKAHIVTQVKRSIAYEKTPNTSTNWVQKQIGIASDQGPGDDWEMDWEHIRDIMDSNKNHYNYVYNYELYDGSQGGNDAAGAPTSVELINAINAGAGLLNYCGHGGDNSCTTTGFSSSDVPNLTNADGKWPAMYVTACLNGNFALGTCIAEELLRATDGNGNPTGAAATLMSTILQSWDPPMEGQDEINAILRGARPGNKKTTFGAMAMNGCMSVNDKYNTANDTLGGSEITDTWTVFGDPSLELRTKHEGSLTCTHTAEMGRNSTWYIVNCPVEGATVGLYYQGEYLASSTVSGGVATFTFPAVSNLDTVFITATKQNYVPYLGYARVIDFPVGVSTVNAAEGLLCYPNPATHQLTLHTARHERIVSVRINNLQGQTMLSLEPNIESATIVLDGLCTGMYFAEVTTEGKTYSTKFLKQ